MNLSNIFGTHSVFYFYGVEHLAINLYTYITEGLKNNERICIAMAPDLYESVMEMMQLQEGFDSRTLQTLMDAFRIGGESALREAVIQVTVEAVEQGYSGVRCIWQPEVIMPESLLMDWQCSEESLTRALAETQCSFLCLADMMDLLSQPILPEKERIRGTLQVHPYILYQMQLKELTPLRA